MPIEKQKDPVKNKLNLFSAEQVRRVTIYIVYGGRPCNDTSSFYLLLKVYIGPDNNLKIRSFSLTAKSCRILLFHFPRKQMGPGQANHLE